MDKIIMYLLDIKMYFQNCLKYFLNRVYNVKNVTIFGKKGKYSIWFRYILLLLCKWLFIKKLYNFILAHFDIDEKRVHIIKTIDCVDKYIIYENNEYDDNKKIIKNANKYLSKHMNNLRRKTMFNPIKSCVLIHDGKQIELKSILQKYRIEGISGNTIKNVLMYNDIPYSDNDMFCITKLFTKNSTWIINDIKNKTIYEQFV